MAARFLLGASPKANPLLRPGFNVNFGLPGWSGDLPKANPRQVTAAPLAGPVYPAPQQNRPQFIGPAPR